MSNKVYDVLKWIVIIVLPALSTLAAALTVIWGFPYGDKIVRTISVVTTFLGTVLMISSMQYKKNKE